MHSGRFVFSQVMDHLPMKTFRRCVQRYQGNRHVQSFTCFDQFLCMRRCERGWHVLADRCSGFGVVLRNGYAEPWAYGYLPPFSLQDNHALSGTALWTGRLLGFDRNGSVVAGDAEIRVAMEALRGSAAFTSLESWSVGSAPGAIGSGAAWGDGDLRYSIAVNGNTFTQIGGGDGTLTGIFTGESHEGAAGTLMLWASTPHRQGPARQSSKLPSSTQL